MQAPHITPRDLRKKRYGLLLLKDKLLIGLHETICWQKTDHMITKQEAEEMLAEFYSPDKSKKLVSFIVQQHANGIQDLKMIFLTKDDKIDILTRLDTQFRWMVCLMLTLFSTTVAILALTIAK